ncbi:hypothetical protein APHAL10511_003012 [Amanita phalloides]|nr:hypothetical protein APHAL10511_003012 [Amanita phalloides]
MSTLPPVVGINLGNSYASISVFTKESVAECIANQDGERQIACAIAFIGQEVYIGNQAKPHLVKNAKNTIQGFRDLLAVSFTELPAHLGSVLVQHPDDPSVPAWKLAVLQPAPSPLPPSSTTLSLSLSLSRPPTAHGTPEPSALATPVSEPVPTTRFVTPLEATALFLRSLAQSAEDFLGKPLTGAVITVPSFFTPAQRSALLRAAKDASVPVFQLLDEAGAAALTTLSPSWSPTHPLAPDRTQLLIDVGHSSTTLTLIALRGGLILPLASSAHQIGGHTLDALLLKHFCAEFAKKTKTPLAANDPNDSRSIQKLLLSLEHTKRTISASPSAASLSIESLKAGIDYTTTINRMRFDLLARPFYTSVSEAVLALLASTLPAPTDPTAVDEMVYVGGTASLPGLDEHLMGTCGFKEDMEGAFKRGDVVGGGVGDPTTVLSRGCAYQALLVNELVQGREEKDLLVAFEEAQEEQKGLREVSVTSRTVGLVLPRKVSGAGVENGSADPGKTLMDELTKSAGGTYIPLILKETPLPARRVVDFALVLAPDYPSQPDGGKKVVMELWEVEESIKIEKRKPLMEIDEDEDAQDEEEEEEEVKHDVLNKIGLLGVLEVPVKTATSKNIKGKPVEASGNVEVQVKATRSMEGVLVVEVGQVGGTGKVVLQI